MKETVIDLGDIFDPELKQVYIKSMQITPIVYWIHLVQKLDDPQIEKVEITCTPPSSTVNNTYTIQLAIEDVPLSNPVETLYDINIFVKPRVDSGYSVSTDDQFKNNDTIKEAVASSPNINGVIVVLFDFDMIMPEDILEWTSQNEGGDHFELVYVPSTESEIYFEEAEVVQHMNWTVKSIGSRSVDIQLNFTEPLAVSTSPYDKDLVSFMILKPQVFIIKNENRPLKWRQEERQFVLVQQIGDEAILRALETLSNSIGGTLKAFMSTNFAATFFISGSL